MPAGDEVLYDSGQHAQTGNAEAEPPTNVLSHPAACEWRKQRAQIDPHVEKRKAGVAARIARRVQLADDGRHVALQQAGAANQQNQAEVERRFRRHHQAELAASDEDAADQHGAPLSGDAVGNPAAAQTHQIDHPGV